MTDNHTPEVRYQMLRPAQVVARRTACPIAYVPLGNLEWHGPQNPLGADTLQAEGVAIRAAQRGGGVVLPPLWYFSPLHETTGWIDPSRHAIAAEMALPEADFVPELHHDQPRAANEAYQHLLCDILGRVHTTAQRPSVGVFSAILRCHNLLWACHSGILPPCLAKNTHKIWAFPIV